MKVSCHSVCVLQETRGQDYSQPADENARRDEIDESWRYIGTRAKRRNYFVCLEQDDGEEATQPLTKRFESWLSGRETH